MTPVCVLLALALPLAITSHVHAGAKKQSAVSIRFYPEGGAEGGEFSQKVDLINPHRSTYMGEIPLISEREIKAYYPFQAGDGSFGAYFKLDDHGTNLLAQHTMSRRGSYILVFFNGRHVVDLYVDKAVQDGIAVIPSGLTPADMELLSITFSVIGHEDIKPLKPKKEPKEPQLAPSSASAPAKPAAPGKPVHMKRQPDGTMAPAAQ
jgi:hypothetical protein